jgi:regulatory protein
MRRGEARSTEALGPEARLQHALDQAFRYLGRGDRTIAEMHRHLDRRGVEPAVIATVLDELEEQGYLDDKRFARMYAEDRRMLDAWGKDRIRRKLVSVGIDAELADAVLAQWGDAEEIDAAVALLHRRLGEPPADNRERDRALGILLRRGYQPDLAYDAVRCFERSFTDPIADCA